jgi:hypothetical protein
MKVSFTSNIRHGACLLILAVAGACSVCSSKAVGFFLNSNFEAGNTGFGSDLIFDATPPFHLTQNGAYAIATNPNHWFFSWANMGDHTTGTGNMLLATPNPGDSRAWYQSVDVIGGVTYTFSGWAAHVDVPNPNVAVLSFKAGNSSLGTLDLAAFGQGNWAQFSFDYTPQSDGSVEFSISSLATSGDGNDFVLDDLGFAPIPEPGMASLAVLGAVTWFISRRRSS